MSKNLLPELNKEVDCIYFTHLLGLSIKFNYCGLNIEFGVYEYKLFSLEVIKEVPNLDQYLFSPSACYHSK